MDLVMLAASCTLQGSIFVTPPEPACHAAMAQTTKAEISALQQWQPFITEAANRFAIPPGWIARVMQAESAGRTTLNGHSITSPKGAMGLMQLMPGTYADMRRIYHLGLDPYAPRDNILAGAAYLRAMADQFGPGAFAAYNAGPRRYQAFLAGKQELPAETISYIAKLQQPDPSAQQSPGVLLGNSPGNGLFFPLSSATTDTRSGGLTVRNPQSNHADSAPVLVTNRQAPTLTSLATRKNLFVVLSSDNRNTSQ